MDFLNHRQRVIAQNISNSDTPGYKPKDLVPVDFDTVLRDVTKTGGVRNVRLATTQAGHSPAPGDIAPADVRKQKHTYEVAPAGNAVVMEEQLIKSERAADAEIHRLRDEIKALKAEIERLKGHEQ